MQSSESTEPIVTSETSIPVATDPISSGASTLAQLNTLIEESMQIYELEDQKTNIIEDLHNALKIITEFLSFSVNVHPGIFNLPSDSSIVLLPNLELIIKLSNGKTETKKFADYPPETITQIIEYVTPQLIGLIQTQKTYLTEKITFLRTATKQLNTLSQLKENLPNILPTETPENIV
ncbi:MAG TPA: hypothetical protein VIH04_04330 [Nitrosarchaeum sp.]